MKPGTMAAHDASFFSAEQTLPWRSLWKVLAVALLIRVVWGLLVPVVPESDSHAYDTFARNLVNHGVFGWTAAEPFAFWPPGTSIFYAAIYSVFGFSYVAVTVANLLVGLGMVWCTARVVTRFFGPQAGLWAAVVLAVWPTIVMHTTLIVSEQLFIFLVIATLDAWTLPRRAVWVRGIVAGLLLGAAALVRPTALLLPGVFAAAMAFGPGREQLGPRLREQVTLAAVAGVVMLCLILPWSWRNYQLFGHFVLVSTNGGVTLWMGNAPGTNGDFLDLPDTVKGMNDYQRNVILGALGRQYILDDLPGFVARSCMKLVRLYNNESIGVLWNTGGITQAFGADAVAWFKRFTQVSWAAIFALCLVGGGLMARARGVWRTLVSPLPLMMLYFSVVHAVVVAADRYHLVMATQVAAFGGYAIATFLQRRRPAPGPQPSVV